MAFNIIHNQTDLAQLCQHLSTKAVIAIDTEFVRERSFYPELGLIQIFDGDNIFLIDPIEITDWQAFKAIIEADDIIKVIHSCSEDIEVLRVALNAKANRFYDTQIAEGLISGKTAMGLAVLVDKYTGTHLEKGHARTNWLKRPLSQEQLKYAADDVLYLLDVYQQQTDILDKRDHLSIVYADTQDIIDKKFRNIAPENAWREVKCAWQLSRRELAVLKELIQWRLEYAMAKNLAVNFVVHERSLILLCQRRPGNLKSLSHIPGIHPLEIKRHGPKLLACIERGKAVAEEDCPEKIKRVAELSGYKQVYSALKAETQKIADELNLSVDVIASKRMINQYIGYYWQVTPWSQETLPELIQGWRGQQTQARLAKVFAEFESR